jgi:malonate transporter and related proteins
MNISGLVSALPRVFFGLALGYFAGKRNAFDSDQAAGLSKLAVPSRSQRLCLSA